MKVLFRKTVPYFFVLLGYKLDDLQIRDCIGGSCVRIAILLKFWMQTLPRNHYEVYHSLGNLQIQYPFWSFQRCWPSRRG